MDDVPVSARMTDLKLVEAVCYIVEYTKSI